MELDDDDLIVLEEEIPVEIEVEVIAASPRVADRAKTVPRRRSTIPPPSMRPIDERIEDDVAGQCLASIAAEVRPPQSASGIRAIVPAAPIEKTPDPAISASYTIPPAARLPRITAPPFVRPQAAPGMRTSTSPSAFARRSSSQFPAAAPVGNVITKTVEIPTVRGHVRSETPPPVVSSLVPVAVPSEAKAVEPTVIVLRERPKVGWIVASAAIGALCALAAAKLVTSSHDDGPAAAAQTTSTTTIATAVMNGPAPAAPLPPVATTNAITPNPMLANPAPITAPAPATTGAVVRFADEQGVAIAAPKPTTAVAGPAAKPAIAPAPAAPKTVVPAKTTKPVKSPMLPDGSFPLGHGETKSAAAPAPAPPPPVTNTPSQAEKAAQAALATTILPSGTSGNAVVPAAEPPPPPRRRALTPEQQIADAQLKASMK